MLLSPQQGYFFHQASTRTSAPSSEDKKKAPKSEPAEEPKESEEGKPAEEADPLYEVEGPGAGGGYIMDPYEDRVEISVATSEDEDEEEEPIYEAQGPGAGGGYDDDEASIAGIAKSVPPKGDEAKAKESEKSEKSDKSAPADKDKSTEAPRS